MNSASSFSACCRSRGFTLVEMLITLVIFILLCSAIFGIVSGVLHGSAALVDNQNRTDQMTALNAYLKNKLSGLPGQSFLLSYRRASGDGLNQNGIVFGGNGGLVAIDATPQANGYYLLRRGLVPMNGTMPQMGGVVAMLPDGLLRNEDPSFNWVPLIRDVKHLEWRFQEPTSTLWEERWQNSALKPNIVELTIQLAGDLQPTTMDFWLPPIVPVLLNTPAATPSPTSPPGSQPSPSHGP